MLDNFIKRRTCWGTNGNLSSQALRIHQSARRRAEFRDHGAEVQRAGHRIPLSRQAERYVPSGNRAADAVTRRTSRSLVMWTGEVDVLLPEGRAETEVSRMSERQKYRVARSDSDPVKQVAELMEVIARPRMVDGWRKGIEREAVRVLRRKYGEAA